MLDTSKWSLATRTYYEAELKSLEKMSQIVRDIVAERKAKLAQQQTSSPE